MVANRVVHPALSYRILRVPHVLLAWLVMMRRNIRERGTAQPSYGPEFRTSSLPLHTVTAMAADCLIAFLPKELNGARHRYLVFDSLLLKPMFPTFINVSTGYSKPGSSRNFVITRS